jgi:hypothetical protein
MITYVGKQKPIKSIAYLEPWILEPKRTLGTTVPVLDRSRGLWETWLLNCHLQTQARSSQPSFMSLFHGCSTYVFRSKWFREWLQPGLASRATGMSTCHQWWRSRCTSQALRTTWLGSWQLRSEGTKLLLKEETWPFGKPDLGRFLDWLQLYKLVLQVIKTQTTVTVLKST